MFQNSIGLRIAFIFAGGFLLYEGFQNWLRGDIDLHPEVVILCLIAYALAFFMLFISTLEDRVIYKLEILVPFSLIFSALFSIYVISEIFYIGVYRTDAMAFTHYAAYFWNFPSWNPYGADMQKALEMFSVNVDYLTLTMEGNIITQLNYPALHFLIYVPFILMGLMDVRWVTVLFLVVMIVYIYTKAPKKLRALVIIPLFAGSDLSINFTAGCLTDILWVLPLLVVIFEFKNDMLSGAFYGMACSIKQNPWILAPFLLIKKWKESAKTDGVRVRLLKLIKFSLTSFIFFIIPNIFFILKNPKVWYSGISNPVFGNLLVVSQGLSMLTQSGMVPLPAEFYTICASTIFIALLFNYFVYFDKLRHAIWLFPAAILWFSYRGLQNYFIYWIPLLVASLILIYKEELGE